MQLTDLWPLALTAARAIGRRCIPPMRTVAEEAGFADMSWTILLPARNFAPDPISPARLRVRTPYTAPRVFERRLAIACDLGFLAPVGEGIYHLTEAGWDATGQIVTAGYVVLGAMAPLPIEHIEELSAYLHRLVLACLYADEPTSKWSIEHSRRDEVEDMAAPVIRIDQYLSDLNAFRDDAHLAGWKPSGVPGHGWEAFTLLWRGEASTLAEIHEKLSWRGYLPEEYAAALNELSQRLWLTIDGSNYRLTDKGRDLRQLAEDETDRVFFAPWTCLSAEELAHLGRLLSAFRKVVGALPESD
jgi:hypothetical protein